MISDVKFDSIDFFDDRFVDLYRVCISHVGDESDCIAWLIDKEYLL